MGNKEIKWRLLYFFSSSFSYTFDKEISRNLTDMSLDTNSKNKTVESQYYGKKWWTQEYVAWSPEFLGVSLWISQIFFIINPCPFQVCKIGFSRRRCPRAPPPPGTQTQTQLKCKLKFKGYTKLVIQSGIGIWPSHTTEPWSISIPRTWARARESRE